MTIEYQLAFTKSPNNARIILTSSGAFYSFQTAAQPALPLPLAGAACRRVQFLRSSSVPSGDQRCPPREVYRLTRRLTTSPTNTMFGGAPQSVGVRVNVAASCDPTVKTSEPRVEWWRERDRASEQTG